MEQEKQPWEVKLDNWLTTADRVFDKIFMKLASILLTAIGIGVLAKGVIWLWKSIVQ